MSDQQHEQTLGVIADGERTDLDASVLATICLDLLKRVRALKAEICWREIAAFGIGAVVDCHTTILLVLSATRRLGRRGVTS